MLIRMFHLATPCEWMCQGEALISVYVVCRFFEDERHIPDVQERQMSQATRQVDVRLALLQCSAPLHTTVEILKLPYEWKMATLSSGMDPLGWEKN